MTQIVTLFKSHTAPQAKPFLKTNSHFHRYCLNVKTAGMLFVTCLVLALTAQPAAAQFGGLGSQDPAQVRSSDVSDQQLRMAAEEARARGLTMDQALQLAQQQGLPASEAQMLRQRVIALGLNRVGSTSGGGSAGGAAAGATRTIGSMAIGGGQFISPQQFVRPPRIETEQMRQTFGSEIFREQITEFTPMQNMATPASYTLGPGDELMVNIWGDQTNLHTLTVSPEGTVAINNLSPVYVNGLDISEAENRIKQSLQQIYSGLRPGSEEQTTYATVSINRLRSIQVALTGDVVNSGDFAVSSNATVFNALYRAGGPDENGSYRNIRVVRDNEIVAELDLYDYLVDGMQADNIRLRDQDVIHVMPYRNRVFIEGEVKRNELFYEMQDGETLQDLIRFAGYFTDRAYTGQISVRRNTPTERRIITVDQAEFPTFEMAGGDRISVDEILDRFENRVSITGAVWRSGEFELTDGMTLFGLISEAQGLRPDAFMTRGLINRMRNDYTFEQIHFDISDLMENPAAFDVPLQREDHVIIRSIHEMKDEQTVQIGGAVRSTGTFTWRDNMTLEDLILLADGFNEAGSAAHIEISRRIMGDQAPTQRGNQLAEIFTFAVSRDLRLNAEDAAFRLQPFDQVFVRQRPDYQQQMTVEVEGQLLYPGSYTISDRDERISDLVQRSGGLTNEAYLAGARLLRQYSSIDRPAIQLDFLTSEDIVDEASLESRNDSSTMVDAATVTEEDSTGISDLQGVEGRRTGINRRTLIAPQVSLGQGMSEAGGARTVAIDLAEILRNPGSSEDLFLREGDVLIVPEQLQTVAVAGAVMQDVEVRFQPGMNLRDYINQAGGLADNARAGRAFIIYPNGDVDRRRQYLFGLIKSSPRIEPGSQIVVPAKPDRPPMDLGELISVSAAIVGMTTSLIIAMDRLSK